MLVLYIAKSHPDMNMIATSSMAISAVLKDGFTPDKAVRSMPV